MATGVIRNFVIQAQTPAYFPLIFRKLDEKEETLGDKLEEREDEEEDEEDEEVEAQEEEEACLEEAFLNSTHYALDVTKQLLRFADLISRDVQRYFGRSSEDHESCDIYSDSISMTTSGRLRYYDDLLRLARAGSPEEQENRSVTYCDDQGVLVAKGNSSLGPLAELFDHRGPSQGLSQPMIKRHLPLSFWTEPIPSCSLVGFSNTAEVTPAQDNTGAHTHMHYSALSHLNTHTLDSTQPDFSDLLANWDPNPELAHALTESAHVQN